MTTKSDASNTMLVGMVFSVLTLVGGAVAIAQDAPLFLLFLAPLLIFGAFTSWQGFFLRLRAAR